MFLGKKIIIDDFAYSGYNIAKRVVTETRNNPTKLRINEGGHIEQGPPARINPVRYEAAEGWRLEMAVWLVFIAEILLPLRAGHNALDAGRSMQ